MTVPPVSEGIFFLDRERPVGLQAQLRETLVSGILSGRLLPGTRLPSTRRLASYLNISRITVTLAYQELAAEGYIEPQARSAYSVSDSAPVARLRASDEAAGEDAVDWSTKLKPRFQIAKTIRSHSTGGAIHILSSTGRWIRRFSTSARGATVPGGRSDATISNTWRAISRRRDDMQLVSYICSRTLPRRGIRARPEEILVTLAGPRTPSGSPHSFCSDAELTRYAKIPAIPTSTLH